MDPIFIKGILAFAISVAVFIGSVWLLLSMILGVKLGYMVTGSVLWGIMVIITGLWVVIAIIPIPSLGLGAALGPKGPETAWHGVGIGPELSAVKTEYGAFDVSDYPDGKWQVPAKGRRLADLKRDEDTKSEVESAKPVMDGFLGDALSPIPGKRKEVEKALLGDVNLTSGQVQIINIRIKEETVDEKDSLVAMGTAVPSDLLVAGQELKDITEEAVVTRYLVKPGDKVSVGDPVIEAKVGSETLQLEADKDGRLISFGLRVDDKIKSGVPFATIDLSGLPGAPEPVEVLAVRVRGAVKAKSITNFFIPSLILFALHLFGLDRMEREKKVPAQPLPTPQVTS